MTSSALVFANHQQELDEDHRSFCLLECLETLSEDIFLFELLMDTNLNSSGWPCGIQFMISAAAIIYQSNIIGYDFTNKMEKPVEINSQNLNFSKPHNNY